MGYSQLEHVAKQYLDNKLPTNPEEKKEIIEKKYIEIVEEIVKNITSANKDVKNAEKALEDSRYPDM